METTTTSSHSPTSIDKPSTHAPLRCPAPAGQTPNTTHSRDGTQLVPSPVECASPTSGNMFHPATPIPVTAAFHNTPASPVPTFAVNDQPTDQAVNSPAMCGPTPASTPVHHSFIHSPPQGHVEFATETFHPITPAPAPVTTSSSPTLAPITSASPSTSAPHLSTLKGNFTSLLGKVTHNPDKQQAGNVMIATRKEEKAKFFEQQATEWELKGNTAKAQKSREKAARCRQMAQAKLHEPLATPANKSAIKSDKATKMDQKAQEYERKGDEARAVKCHNKVSSFLGFICSRA